VYWLLRLKSDNPDGLEKQIAFGKLTPGNGNEPDEPNA
jgi:hypothetical protein